MRILLLAPHPFFVERGTPIAVRLMARTLCNAGHTVDLFTYHEGRTIHHAGLKIYRIASPPGIRNVPIGFSAKKLLCDIFMIADIPKMLLKGRYDVVHAVEEMVFPALIFKQFFDYQLVYDMDSSMADQMVEKYHQLSKLKRFLVFFEKAAAVSVDAVVPVCDALAEKIRGYAPHKKTCVLHDVPMISDDDPGTVDDLKTELRISGKMALYVGNLEQYQGIDLVLEAMTIIGPKSDVSIVFIGGNQEQIKAYKKKSDMMGLKKSAHFIGPRPIGDLSAYLAQADILLSPRIKGSNTPMKIYSYMASGKAIVATKIASHTQVLDESCALLISCNAIALAKGIEKLVDAPDVCWELGRAAASKVQSDYSVALFEKKLLALYDWLKDRVQQRGGIHEA